MTAKEYLRRIRGLELDLRTIEEEIVEIETALTKITPSMQTDGWVQSSIGNDKLTDSVCKLIDKKREFEKAWDVLIDERENAEQIIYKLNNRDHAMVLWKYYIKAKSFESIAVDMCFSYRHITRMHGFALEEFRILYDSCPSMSYKTMR